MLPACESISKDSEKVLDKETAESLESITEDIATVLITQEPNDFTSSLLEYNMDVDEKLIAKSIESWNEASPHLGEYVCVTGKNAFYNRNGNIVVILDIIGEKRTGRAIAIYKGDSTKILKSLTIEINWTTGEKIERIFKK